jgi:hypothetical protein
MSTVCYSSIKGLAMRATRLNSAGEWETGATASVVSKGFVTISLSANIEEGEEFLVKNAQGQLCINEKDQSRLKYMNLEIEFCEVNPVLFELMTGVRVLGNWDGDNVGFSMAEELQAAPHALEVWTKVTGGTSGGQYVYWLLPRVVNGIAGDFTVENGPMTFTLSANTQDNAAWGKGPYDVVAQDAQLTPGVLQENVLAGEHVYHRLTELPPPTAVCGYVDQNTAYAPPSP